MDLFLPMLTLGLVTSLHCVSMCGPMVACYALKDAEEGSLKERLTPNLAYQGAKILSYMIVGLALGAIGSAFNFDSVRPYVMLAAGAFMIALGLGMTGRFPWFANLTPRPPKFLMKAFASTRRKASADSAAGKASLSTPVTFGLLTGLMPCAPLIAAQLNAATSGNALTGALGMFAFGLGTAPLMLGFGAASTMMPPRLKQRVMSLLAIVVIVFGVVYLNRGAMLVGSPLTLKSIQAAVVGTPATADVSSYTTGDDGIVEIPLVIENVRFVPDTLSLPADQPVRLIVDRREANACSDQLAVPQMGVLVDLAPNAVTEVLLPAAPQGAYTLTCGMGMMYGQLQVGGASAAGGNSWLVPLVVVGGLGAAGAYYVQHGKRRASAPANPKKGTRAAASAAPATSGGLLGLSPVETILASGAVGLAVILGLAFGGFFS